MSRTHLKLKMGESLCAAAPDAAPCPPPADAPARLGAVAELVEAARGLLVQLAADAEARGECFDEPVEALASLGMFEGGVVEVAGWLATGKPEFMSWPGCAGSLKWGVESAIGGLAGRPGFDGAVALLAQARDALEALCCGEEVAENKSMRKSPAGAKGAGQAVETKSPTGSVGDNLLDACTKLADAGYTSLKQELSDVYQDMQGSEPDDLDSVGDFTSRLEDIREEVDAEAEAEAYADVPEVAQPLGDARDLIDDALAALSASSGVVDERGFETRSADDREEVYQLLDAIDEELQNLRDVASITEGSGIDRALNDINDAVQIGLGSGDDWDTLDQVCENIEYIWNSVGDVMTSSDEEAAALAQLGSRIAALRVWAGKVKSGAALETRSATDFFSSIADRLRDLVPDVDAADGDLGTELASIADDAEAHGSQYPVGAADSEGADWDQLHSDAEDLIGRIGAVADYMMKLSEPELAQQLRDIATSISDPEMPEAAAGSAVETKSDAPDLDRLVELLRKMGMDDEADMVEAGDVEGAKQDFESWFDDSKGNSGEPMSDDEQEAADLFNVLMADGGGPKSAGGSIEAKSASDPAQAGAEAGKAAASWYEPSDWSAVLQGIEDGDPEVLDTFPYLDVSGQNADGTTEEDIKDDLDFTGDDDEWDNVFNEYRDAFDLAVQEEIERMARAQKSSRGSIETKSFQEGDRVRLPAITFDDGVTLPGATGTLEGEPDNGFWIVRLDPEFVGDGEDGITEVGEDELELLDE